MPIKGKNSGEKNPETGAANAPERVGSTEKTEASPSGTGRAGREHLRDTIEAERKEKQARRDFLKDESAKRRNSESWTGNKPEEGFGSSVAQGVINSGVEEKFAAYIDQFRENGLGDPTNVNVIKQAAKDIIYQHYLKTGNDKDTTTEYIKKGLGEKLKYLLNGLREINANPKYGFKKPIDTLQAFSDFTALKFIDNGYANLENLKKALLLEKSDFEFFLKSFTQYLNINLELVDLSGREATAAAKEPEKMDVGAMLKDGKIALKNPARVTFTSDAAGSLEQAKKEIHDRLPDNTDPKAKDVIAAYLAEEVKKAGAGAGETVEVSVNGTVRKIDLSAEQAAQATSKDKAEKEVQKASTESAEGLSGGIGKFIAALLAILQKLMGSFGNITAKFGLGEEFAGLDESETKDGAAMKAYAEKSGLNLKTLSPLFQSAEQMKKVLKIKKDKGLEWEDYFKKYLSAAETAELKKEQKLDPEKTAEMFISPVEDSAANA
jgi:hypothetical protein